MTLKQWIADKPKRKRAKFLNIWLPTFMFFIPLLLLYFLVLFYLVLFHIDNINTLNEFKSAYQTLEQKG